MKRLLTIPIMLLALSVGTPAAAGDQGDQSIGKQLTQARLEGQLWATYALNRHLSPFDIDVDVRGDTAVLKGKVENDVQKDLAGQIALGVDGINDVDNELTVSSATERSSRANGDKRSFGDRVDDLTTTATIKSKLLWNRNTGGMAIDVSTKDGRVTLKGRADSGDARALAGQLAANTEGVKSVDNQIEVRAKPKDEKTTDLGAAVSDAWITTKVKSTLLFSRSVSGTAIDVDTKDGVVSLKGKVGSGAERELAVKLSEDIRGVRKVDASGLEVNG